MSGLPEDVRIAFALDAMCKKPGAGGRYLRRLRSEEAKKEAPQKPPSRVEVGSKVIVGLRGGGRVEGILARRSGHGVVIEDEEGADVIVLESASYGTRVLTKE